MFNSLMVTCWLDVLHRGGGWKEMKWQPANRQLFGVVSETGDHLFMWGHLFGGHLNINTKVFTYLQTGQIFPDYRGLSTTQIHYGLKGVCVVTKIIWESPYWCWGGMGGFPCNLRIIVHRRVNFNLKIALISMVYGLADLLVFNRFQLTTIGWNPLNDLYRFVPVLDKLFTAIGWQITVPPSSQFSFRLCIIIIHLNPTHC